MYNNFENTVNYIEPTNIIDNKPYCVFGVLLSDKGKQIKEEMLNWLLPNFNVYIVEQKMPGKYFEYPAILYMKNLILNKNLPYCLYVHTKGAYYDRETQQACRYMWKEEFTNNLNWYVNILNSNDPTVACPFTGKCKTTWLNGFMINNACAKEVNLKWTPYTRYYYETIFEHENNIKVIGRISNNHENKDKNDPEKIKVDNYIKSFKI